MELLRRLSLLSVIFNVILMKKVGIGIGCEWLNSIFWQNILMSNSIFWQNMKMVDSIFWQLTITY